MYFYIIWKIYFGNYMRILGLKLVESLEF